MGFVFVCSKSARFIISLPPSSPAVGRGSTAPRPCVSSAARVSRFPGGFDRSPVASRGVRVALLSPRETVANDAGVGAWAHRVRSCLRSRLLLLRLCPPMCDALCRFPFAYVLGSSATRNNRERKGRNAPLRLHHATCAHAHAQPAAAGSGRPRGPPRFKRANEPQQPPSPDPGRLERQTLVSRWICFVVFCPYWHG